MISIIVFIGIERLKTFQRKERKNKPNKLIKAIANCIENMVFKLDYFINENDKGNDIDIKELNNFFLLNILQNSIKQYEDISEKESQKSIYNLRNKVQSEDLDDDFYYDEKNS